MLWLQVCSSSVLPQKHHTLFLHIQIQRSTQMMTRLYVHLLINLDSTPFTSVQQEVDWVVGSTNDLIQKK
jgi:hypothetical protein